MFKLLYFFVPLLNNVYKDRVLIKKIIIYLIKYHLGKFRNAG